MTPPKRSHSVSEMSPAFWTVAELGTAYAKRDLSPLEVTGELLDRIDVIDPKLHSFLSIAREEALAQARRAEKAFASRGRHHPLLGVPVSIKDLFEMKGYPTTFGSTVCGQECSSIDSPAVAMLRGAGAVLIGKTNTAEFGQSATTENNLGPDGRNPWDTDRTAGGSSGGAAASVGAGLASIALASDGGGSIRIPAAMCGLFGIKPTYGRAPAEGTLKSMTEFDCAGPLARRVADARPLLEVLLERPYRRSATSIPLRIAWCPAPEDRPVDPAVATLTGRAISELADMGHEVVEFPIPVEGWAEIFGPLVLRDEWRYRKHLLEEDPNALTDYARSSIEAGSRITESEIERALVERSAFRSRIASLFDHFDLLATPATAAVAFPVGERPSKIDGVRVGRRWGAFPFTAPFNVSGSPAASIPCGVADGLPVGLQMIGPDDSEAILLDLCEDLEERLDFPSERMSETWAGPG